MDLKWYAVYTKPRWEKKVAELLSRTEVQYYCPLNKVVKQWSDRKKVVEEPLFTSYVFVKVNTKLQTIVRQIDGVINFVYWLGKPAIIKDEDIELIKRFLNEHSNVRLERTQFNIDDSVRILNGPFMEFEAKVIKVNNKTVNVILPSLGYTMIAEKENVKVIT